MYAKGLYFNIWAIFCIICQTVQYMKIENHQESTIRRLLLNFCLIMFRASLCPSSGEQRPCYCIWCVLVLLDVVVSGCGALSCRMRAVWRFLFCLNMFRASLCPSSGEQRNCYCIWCVVLVLLDVVGSGAHILQDSAPQPLLTTSSRTRTTHQMQ